MVAVEAPVQMAMERVPEGTGFPEAMLVPANGSLTVSQVPAQGVEASHLAVPSQAPASFSPGGWVPNPSAAQVHMTLVQENTQNNLCVNVIAEHDGQRDAEIAHVAAAAGAAVAQAQAETSAVMHAAQGAVQHAVAEQAAQQAVFAQQASAMTAEYHHTVEANQAREMELMVTIQSMRSRMEQMALDRGRATAGR